MNTSAPPPPFFFGAESPSFGQYCAADELMHREINALHQDSSVVETQYLGFNVPEANVACISYLWTHPHLRLMGGGSSAWQGIKADQLTAELFDMRDLVPDDPVRTDGNIDRFMLPNSYRVDVISPLETIRIRYDDPARDNNFDVTLQAIMPPAMLPSRKHFDQAMKTTGRLVLRGQPHTVDGYVIRDRSWGDPRTEQPLPLPAHNWLTAVFSDDLAIHVSAIEDPATAEWRDDFPVDEVAAESNNRGWVWCNGTLASAQSVRVVTNWNRHTGGHTGHQVTIVDTEGREFCMSGQVTALWPWYLWSNFRQNVALTRWDCNGIIGWGNCGIGYWTDFANAVMH